LRCRRGGHPGEQGFEPEALIAWFGSLGFDIAGCEKKTPAKERRGQEFIRMAGGENRPNQR
jgi:hypothetical protein